MLTLFRFISFSRIFAHEFSTHSRNVGHLIFQIDDFDIFHLAYVCNLIETRCDGKNWASIVTLKCITVGALTTSELCGSRLYNTSYRLQWQQLSGASEHAPCWLVKYNENNCWCRFGKSIEHHSPSHRLCDTEIPHFHFDLYFSGHTIERFRCLGQEVKQNLLEIRVWQGKIGRFFNF